MSNDPVVPQHTPRNAPCPCGSGKRYKHCHGALSQPEQSAHGLSSARTNGGSSPHHQNILASNEPLSVDQAVLRAESLANQGEPDKAEQFYRAVLEKFPENKRAIEGLKSLEKPKPDQEQIVLDKSPARKQINALITLYNQGRLQEALVEGTALAERYPDVPLIPNILGIVNTIMKRPEEAVTNYTKALQLVD
jgi:tetratricopeptide (TPR) repeat protein